MPQVLKIRVPVLVSKVRHPLCHTSPAAQRSKVKQTKRGRNDASTDEDEEEALPKETKKALKSAVIKDPAKKKHKPALPSSDDELPVVPKRRGRPPKPVSEANARFATPVFVEIAQAPTVQHAKNSAKDRFIKQAPKRAGPFELTEKMGWERFLRDIAEITDQQTENFDTTSMSWSFQKKEMYPLTNAAGFKTMVTQVKSLKDPSSAIIVVSLPIPKAQRTTIRAPQTMAEQLEQRLDRMPDDSLYGKKVRLHRRTSRSP